MFDYLRAHSKIFMLLLIVMIIPAFVFWGVSGRDANNSKVAAVAEVDGQDITPYELDNLNNDRIRQLTNQLPSETLHSDNFKYQTLLQLVTRKSVQTLADKYRYAIDNDQFMSIMESNPTLYAPFLTNGQLDLAKLEAAAAQYNVDLATYETFLRSDITLSQFASTLVDTAFYSNSLIEQMLELFTTNYKVAKTAFLAKNYLNEVVVSETELEEYFQQHQQDFITAEKADIEYIALDEAAVLARVDVSEDELKNYYQQNIANKVAERKYRQILFSTNQDNAGAVKQKAAEVLAKLKQQPESFAALAKEYSDDAISAEKGGDNGWTNQQSLPDENLSKAIFNADKGVVVNELIKTDFGYHIIEVTDIKQPPSFAEAKETIISEYKQQKAPAILSELLKSLNDLTTDNSDSLAPAAKELKLTIKQYKDVLRKPLQVDVNDFTTNEEFLAELFSPQVIQDKSNTHSFETNNKSYVVARVTNYYPAVIPKFKQIKAKVSAAVKLEKARALAKTASEKFLVAVNKKGLSFADKFEASLAEPDKLSPAEMLQVLIHSTKKLPVSFMVDLGADGASVIKIIALGKTKEDSLVTKYFKQNIQTSLTNGENSLYLKEFEKLANAKIFMPKPEEENNAVKK